MYPNTIRWGHGETRYHTFMCPTGISPKALTFMCAWYIFNMRTRKKVKEWLLRGADRLLKTQRVSGFLFG